MTNSGDTWVDVGVGGWGGLTEAVQAALYELIQAGGAGTGGRAGALQCPADVLRTGTCIPSTRDQLGLPESVGEGGGTERDKEEMK